MPCILKLQLKRMNIITKTNQKEDIRLVDT